MNKKIIIVGLIMILIIAGVVGFLFIKNNNRLSIEYIGGDKYVDDIVAVTDFKVIDKKTNKQIDSKNIKVSKEPLNKDGTKIHISAEIDKKEYKGRIVVKPTLVIKEIKAEFLPENKHIGSKIEKSNFKVIGINNKNKEVEITNFKLSTDTLTNKENNIRITYKSSIGDISCDLVINVTENFVVGANAKYIGTKLFAGQNVNDENFEVYYVWDDETQTKAEEYKIPDKRLRQLETYIRIFVVDSEGKEFYTDTKVEAKNYITDIDSISYIGEEQTIGNNISNDDFYVYAKYYDGKIEKVNNFTIDSEKTLRDLDNTIKISLKNELGKNINSSIKVRADYNIIYVGDTRIKELKKFTNTRDYKENDEFEKIYYISNDKANLKWLKNTGIKEVYSLLEKNPYTKYKIIFNVGLFDGNNVDKYFEFYKKISQNNLKDHNVYLCSLNPIDESKMEKAKKYSRKQINSVKINEFNEKIEKSVNSANIKNLKYINTYSELKNNAFKTTDGVNYIPETMQVFQDIVKNLTK